MFDRQKFFDTAVKGILAQGGPAYDPNRKICLYRGPNGTKCAVGHNIPNEKYDPMFETLSPFYSVFNKHQPSGVLAAAIGCKNNDDALFAIALQRVHDGLAMPDMLNMHFLKDFRLHAREFAQSNNLNTKVLDQ